MKTHESADLFSWNHGDAEKARQEIIDAVGDLSGLVVTGSKLLVGMYIRPPVKSLIIRAEKEQREDIYQGKVSLILKVGPDAMDGIFPDGQPDPLAELKYSMGGRLPQVGDWIVTSPRRGDDFWVRFPGSKIAEDRIGPAREWHPNSGWPVRLIEMTDVQMFVPDPFTVI